MPRLRTLALFSVMASMVVLSCGCLQLSSSSGDDLPQVQGLDVEERTVFLGLSWTPIDGVDGYRIMRDGEQVGETDLPRFNDSDVDQGIEYTYRVCGLKYQVPMGSVSGPLSDGCSGTLPAMTLNDDGFRDFARDTGTVIQGICIEIQEAGMALDLSGSQRGCQLLEDRATCYLTMSWDFNISSDMIPAMDEYRLAMEDFIRSADLMDRGVSSLNQGMIEEGIELSYSGAQHLENVSNMLQPVTPNNNLYQ